MIALLIDLSVKATLLCLAAAAVTALMRRASAASRHVVWTGMFVAVLALPIARVLLPGLPVFVLAPQFERVPVTVPPPAILTVDANVVTDSTPAATASVSSFASLSSTPAPAVVAEPLQRTVFSASDVVVTLWLCGVFLLLVRAAVGSARVRRLNRSASTVTDSGVLDRVHALRRLFGVRRPILLRACPAWMPMTWGVLRPVILAPSAVIDADGEGRDVLEPLLVHEVAHIARFDVVSAALARFAVACGWFNPFLWLAARQARLERERACDDAVLTRGANLKASDYAQQLVVLAQAAHPALTGGSHTLAMARRSQLEARVRSILDARTNRQSTSRASRVVAATLVVVAIPVAAVRLAARTVTQVHVHGSVEPVATPTPVETPIDVTAVADLTRRQPPFTSRAPIPTPLVTQSPAPQATAPSTAVIDTPAQQLAAARQQLADLQIHGMLETHPTMRKLKALIAQLSEEVQASAPPPVAPAQGASPPNFVIGVNDLLTVIVWRAPELSGDVRVRPDGKIALSAGNDIQASGLTTEQLKASVIAEVKKCCYADPDVIIQVKEILSRAEFGRGRQFFFFNQPEVSARLTQPPQTGEWGSLWNILSVRELKAEALVIKKIEIGTSAPLDLSEFKRARQALDDVAATPHHTDFDVDALRSRFGAAVRNLDAVEIRFANGLETTKPLVDAYVAAAESLKDVGNIPFRIAAASGASADARFVNRPGTNTVEPGAYSDAELTAALKNAAIMSPDTGRADMLLSLAQRYAFTPDMVALYVSAANGIKSDAERARVFAQAIRIKGK